MAARLTPKQERFVEEYMVDLNATAAAARAGYRDPNIGRQLITKNSVAAAIAEARGNRSRRTKITADAALERLQQIVEQEASDAPTSSLRVSSQLRAIELLLKHLGQLDGAGRTQEDDGGGVIVIGEASDGAE